LPARGFFKEAISFDKQAELKKGVRGVGQRMPENIPSYFKRPRAVYKLNSR